MGVAGHLARDTPLGGSWLTATLGPTGYVIVAHPRSATSRRRNGLIGHAAGIAVGLGALAAFGLWDTPSVAVTHGGSFPQVLAQAVALGGTLLVLTLADAHHAPAGATTLLVASGVAAPGPGLIGLVVGLAIVLALAPLLAGLPGRPPDTAGIEARETPMG